MSVNDAYSQMATSGLYGKPQGLNGLYDNVRRFWEDKVATFFMHPYLKEIRQQCSKKGRKVRILDLGCGCGDGFELLTEATEHHASPQKVKVKVLPEEAVALYLGIDLNDELLNRGREYFSASDNVRFSQRDFTKGLGVEGVPPFDIYLANYGTLSHCNDTQLEELLQRIIEHSGKKTLFIGEWLGAYSCDWQDWWVDPLKKDHTLPYRFSYFYDDEQSSLAPEPIHMRLMDRSILSSLINRLSLKTGTKINVLEVFDRSLLVGRHLETGEYNRYPQKIRSAVNSLLEPQCRTDLGELAVRYHPREGFEAINQYYRRWTGIWNRLVKMAEEVLLGEYQPSDFNGIQEETEGCTRNAEEFLPLFAETLFGLIHNSRGLPVEDLRANIIEPQLAYFLRKAEMSFQQGLGMGHGYTVMLEILKK